MTPLSADPSGATVDRWRAASGAVSKGVSTFWRRIVEAVRQDPGCVQRDIEEAIGVRPGAATSAIADLVASKELECVVEENDPKRPRRYWVHGTRPLILEPRTARPPPRPEATTLAETSPHEEARPVDATPMTERAAVAMAILPSSSPRPPPQPAPATRAADECQKGCGRRIPHAPGRRSHECRCTGIPLTHRKRAPAPDSVDSTRPTNEGDHAKRSDASGDESERVHAAPAPHSTAIPESSARGTTNPALDATSTTTPEATASSSGSQHAAPATAMGAPDTGGAPNERRALGGIGHDATRRADDDVGSQTQGPRIDESDRGRRGWGKLREIVLEHVRAHPEGVYQSDLHDLLGHGVPVTAQRLRRAGLIHHQRDGRRFLLLPGPPPITRSSSTTTTASPPESDHATRAVPRRGARAGRSRDDLATMLQAALLEYEEHSRRALDAWQRVEQLSEQVAASRHGRTDP